MGKETFNTFSWTCWKGGSSVLTWKEIFCGLLGGRNWEIPRVNFPLIDKFSKFHFTLHAFGRLLILDYLPYSGEQLETGKTVRTECNFMTRINTKPKPSFHSIVTPSSMTKRGQQRLLWHAKQRHINKTFLCHIS